MKILNLVVLTLLIVGGLNWGLVAFANLDLVATIFDAGTVLAKAVYGLVALSALYAITFYKRFA